MQYETKSKRETFNSLSEEEKKNEESSSEWKSMRTRTQMHKNTSCGEEKKYCYFPVLENANLSEEE